MKRQLATSLGRSEGDKRKTKKEERERERVGRRGKIKKEASESNIVRQTERKRKQKRV